MMDDNNQWAVDELTKLINDTHGLVERATLIAAQELIQEQAKRLQQAADELDGRVWSPNKW